jgi:hypothetical protein
MQQNNSSNDNACILKMQTSLRIPNIDVHLAFNIFLLWLLKIFDLKHFKDCSSSLIASCNPYASPIDVARPQKSNNNKTTQPR